MEHGIPYSHNRHYSDTTTQFLRNTTHTQLQQSTEHFITHTPRSRIILLGRGNLTHQNMPPCDQPHNLLKCTTHEDKCGSNAFFHKGCTTWDQHQCHICRQHRSTKPHPRTAEPYITHTHGSFIPHHNSATAGIVIDGSSDTPRTYSEKIKTHPQDKLSSTLAELRGLNLTYEIHPLH